MINNKFKEVIIELPYWTDEGQKKVEISYEIPEDSAPDQKNKMFVDAIKKTFKKLNKQGQKLCSQ